MRRKSFPLCIWSALYWDFRFFPFFWKSLQKYFCWTAVCIKCIYMKTNWFNIVCVLVVLDTYKTTFVQFVLRRVHRISGVDVCRCVDGIDSSSIINRQKKTGSNRRARIYVLRCYCGLNHCGASCLRRRWGLGSTRGRRGRSWGSPPRGSSSLR